MPYIEPAVLYHKVGPMLGSPERYFKGRDFSEIEWSRLCKHNFTVIPVKIKQSFGRDDVPLAGDLP